MELKFLNKLDNLIFCKMNPEHEGVTGKTFVHGLLAFLVLMLVAFIIQVCSVDEPWYSIILVSGEVLVAGYILYMALPAIKTFDGWGGRIAYFAYVALFGYISFVLSMYLFFIVLVIVIFCGGYKIFFNNGGSSNTIVIEDENGRKHTLKYNPLTSNYTDENGYTWQENADGAFARID